MKQKAKLLSDCSFSKDIANSNIFQYLNKYRLWVTANLLYKGYDFIHCNCYSFYKSYICKHAIKLADIFGFKIKGYNKIEIFAVNAKRGPKSKKKHNPLEID